MNTKDPQQYEFIAEAKDHRQRLDTFLSSRVPDMSREKIKKLIKANCCTIDSQIINVAKTQIIQGQNIILVPNLQKENYLEPEQGQIDIFWQDEDILLINKPFGITVHPCPSCPSNTLIQIIITHFPILQEQDSLRPGIVHRLDKDTSGLMLIALNEKVRLDLMQCFAEHNIKKEYLALVHGIPPNDGIITEPIGRHPTRKVKMAIVPENKGGKAAKSKWTVLYSNYEKNFSLLAIQIFSGRTHQIRVHMAHLGYPLLGDSLYSKKKSPNEPTRQMLHAWKIAFDHPINSEYLQFCCPPPNDFMHVLSTHTQQMQHVIITGNSGCGKSSFTQYLAEQNIPTWNADKVIHKAYEPQEPAWNYLHHCYGELFIQNASSPVNRDKLSSAMKNDPVLKYDIEQFTHKLAKQSLDEFWAKCQQQNCELAIAEVPLFFEANWHHMQNLKAPKAYAKKIKDSDLKHLWEDLTDNPHIQAKDYKGFLNTNVGYTPTNPILVGISCPLEQRFARISKKRNWTMETMEQIESWQWTEQKKMSDCHYVVDNSNNIHDLQKTGEHLLQHLTKLRKLQKFTLDDI